MAVVDAWLKADQSMMSFANDHGIQLCALLDWIMEYGQPPAALMWISVQILDGSVDTPQLNGGYSPAATQIPPSVATSKSPSS
jgi:hypothetical protein